jgi:hypothetical protein
MTMELLTTDAIVCFIAPLITCALLIARSLEQF